MTEPQDHMPYVAAAAVAMRQAKLIVVDVEDVSDGERGGAITLLTSARADPARPADWPWVRFAQWDERDGWTLSRLSKDGGLEQVSTWAGPRVPGPAVIAEAVAGLLGGDLTGQASHWTRDGDPGHLVPRAAGDVREVAAALAEFTVPLAGVEALRAIGRELAGFYADNWDGSSSAFMSLTWTGTRFRPALRMALDPVIPLRVYPSLLFREGTGEITRGHQPAAFALMIGSRELPPPGEDATAGQRAAYEAAIADGTASSHPDAVDTVRVWVIDVHGRVWIRDQSRDGRYDREWYYPDGGKPGGWEPDNEASRMLLLVAMAAGILAWGRPKPAEPVAEVAAANAG